FAGFGRLAHLAAATHPSYGFAASYANGRPSCGVRLAGYLASRKVYMPSVKKILTGVVATALLGAVVPSAAPARPQSPQQEPTIRSQVSLVNLFVTVRDKNKRIVSDLKQEDFKIAEDGQDQKIAFFSKEVTLPITLALLLDTSGSEQFMLGAIQDMGSRFLD